MNLFELFRKKILSPRRVIEKAIQNKLVPPNDGPDYIKNNFSELIEQIQKDAYEIYLREEESVGKEVITQYIKNRLSPSSTVDDVIEIIGSLFSDLDKFFLSLTNSRRPRAGGAFEIILKTLFKKLGYPFDEQKEINGKPDFIMPNLHHYETNPMDCIIFSAKRSLRERWRQIATEGTRGLGFFLATIDKTISKAQLKEMLRNRIYLVVPLKIKKDNEVYHKSSNVISFEDFFRYHLDPAMSRWKDNKVI
jgi:hypothetical protein